MQTANVTEASRRYSLCANEEPPERFRRLFEKATFQASVARR
jgi:hypothetical protein